LTRPFLSFFILVSLGAPAVAVGQSPAAESASTLQANANLVVVDVVVTDSRHSPVHNLTSADFKLLENGQPQTIKTFEEHHTWEAAAPFPPPPKLPPATFTNYTNVPASGALNILLLDSLNTPMSAQADVRNLMLKYLKGTRPGSRMAIFGLNMRLILLQGFASDPELLSDVLNGKKDLPRSSLVLTDAVNGDNSGADDQMMDMAQDAPDAMGNDPNATQVLADLQQFKAETQSLPLELRARITLDALNQIARYLTGLPGRKNLIWFSGSFPINILPDGDLENPFSAVASSEDEFRETTDLLSRSQVAVYPIDARSLMVAPMLDAGNSGAQYARTTGSIAKDEATNFQNTSNGHSTMQAMAEATGGEALVNTNGLKEAVEKAIDIGSNYYTLTYAPTLQKSDGEYRRIHVEIARQGLTLAYRRGYFTDDPDKPRRRAEPASAGTGQAPAYNAMRTAMIRGGPDPIEIIFSAHVRLAIADPEPDPAAGNQLAGKISGPYRRYHVLFGIDPHDIDFAAAPDGVRHCELEAAIYVYDVDGALLNSVGGRIESNIPADRYATMLKDGIHFVQDISVPVGQDSFLRIGVHDETTNKVGAIEIPIAAVSKKPQLAAPDTPHATQ